MMNYFKSQQEGHSVEQRMRGIKKKEKDLITAGLVCLEKNLRVGEIFIIL